MGKRKEFLQAVDELGRLEEWKTFFKNQVKATDSRISALHKKISLLENETANLMNDVFLDTSNEDLWKHVNSMKEKLGVMGDLTLPQKQALKSIISGKDTFVTVGAGGGKSLIYQIAAFIGKRNVIVISPYNSLIQNQVRLLEEKGFHPACHNSIKEKHEMPNWKIRTLLTDGHVFHLIYILPEGLFANEGALMTALKESFLKKKLAFFVVDEAHNCFSNDLEPEFRPNYGKLGILKKEFPGIPILALTATASISSQSEIISSLNLNDDVSIIKGPITIENLIYLVLPKPKNPVKEIGNFIKKNYPKESGIIYCSTVYQCKKVQWELRNEEISSVLYFSENGDKKNSQEKWFNEEVPIIVATVAFSAGIHKPNVRFVIHYSMPKSIEAFYQESGRAGRDGKLAHSLLFFSFGDFFSQAGRVFADGTGLRDLYLFTDFLLSFECRKKFLSRHFQYKDSEVCKGKCDNCLGFWNPKSLDFYDFAFILLKLVENFEKIEEHLKPPGLTRTQISKGFLEILKEDKSLSLLVKWKLFNSSVDIVLWHLILQGYLMHHGIFKIRKIKQNKEIHISTVYFLPGPHFENFFKKCVSFPIKFEDLSQDSPKVTQLFTTESDDD